MSFFKELISLTAKTDDVKTKYKALLFVITSAVLYFSLCQPPNLKAHKHFTICIFHNLTGYPCPACGTIRGLKLFFHFDFFQALMMNPLSVIVGSLLIISFLWIIIDLIRQKETFYKTVYFIKVPWYVIVFFALLTAANWYWNIEKGL